MYLHFPEEDGVVTGHPIRNATEYAQAITAESSSCSRLVVRGPAGIGKSKWVSELTSALLLHSRSDWRV